MTLNLNKINKLYIYITQCKKYKLISRLLMKEFWIYLKNIKPI